ncbi:MAG: M3 family oligoendopeptidase [Nitrosopumilaceae archaeon]|nr:M3 family oligoendopeptidase [Nitrosopumilaceae archaeon]NIU00319.1 M3 family oligoendopeptidase [Nitrosopumilaceae archaeon]NIU86721.1 M3 family oligoendopeptidase [Nitrosopumilaceae archaeon]NIV65422.1 M3 family oligoendopeptidase [Nitrosopumilaceae archaeon]NIX60921.1 M3 family oligoendopeptidase [Nitrosopumilaceae archaeon]
MSTFTKGRWDLSCLVSDKNQKDLDRKITQLQNKVEQFEKNKKSLKPDISAKKFMEIVHDLEAISEQMSIIGSFASLSYSADTQSDKATSLLTKITQLSSVIANQTVFFDLWWKKGIDEKNAARLLQNSGDLEEFLRHKRVLAKYSLSEPEEKIINKLDVTGPTALVKLYDKITNSFEYRIKTNGKAKSLTREELTTLVRSTKSRTREQAYKALLTKYRDNKGVLGEIYQNIVLNWKDESLDIRGYESPISVRNIANDIEDKTVESLLKVCRENTDVFQKFFRQKAKMIGKKKLRRYDIYAPSTSRIKEKTYSYQKAVTTVLESLSKFSPKMAEFAENVFKKNHVDSEIRQGKRDGAFCSSPAPKITPYVMLSYAGKTRDVFTLAHEIGHAIHSQAARDKSILVSDAPLPLAETASTFSELLLYDNISQSISDSTKKIMLSEKIDDLYATIMRQSFFTLFEIDAHKQIAGMATVDEISDTYQKNLKEQFANSIQLSDDFSIEWSCIPHFFHTPFYCYAYSFGNLLSLSLFQRYKKEGDKFASDYLNILEAGGAKKPENLLSEHGFDISSAKFWRDGFDYVRNQVDELAKLN